MSRVKKLPHDIPPWVDPSREIYFLTLNCAPRGTNQLALPNVAVRVFETIEFREEKGLWFCYLTLLMPDHLHMLVHFPEAIAGASDTHATAKPLRKIVSEWKGWVAKQLQIHWQDDFFEHRLRSDESRSEKARYILENPVRAGLVQRVEDWPYSRVQGI